ncbi:MAG: methionine adenosyltransferase, partial [bacterium]
MSKNSVLFTSESVSEGHPDKVCDQISDAILDEALRQDRRSRVACECFVTTGLIIVGGEITTKAIFDVQDIARQVVRDIGYTKAGIGFDADGCAVMSTIHRQSPDIAMGVDETKEHEQGAGDQGMMFGFACDETPELMPLPITLAHKLVKKLAAIRKSNRLKYLRPDSKSQVTVEYVNGKPKRIHTVVLSTQHDEKVTQAQIKKDLTNLLILPTLPKRLV